ncbi:TetR/AcrR family transcriptional regulator [Rhodococcus sp. WS4]|nr:TetR/AcrR family transcriptional regulator [Rhodococcus sp. WS4]
MDPRYRRSRERFRGAVYQLATLKPITEVQVQELCEAAGVTKDTFYRHATSPVDLLADVLAEEFDAITVTYDDLAGSSAPEAPIGVATRVLLQHVLDHEAVYRKCMQPHLIAPIRATLEDAARTALERHFAAHPEVLPPTVEPAPVVLAIYAGYGAAGIVGALEAWISAPEHDIATGVAAILATMPAWWFTKPEPSTHPQQDAISEQV